MNREKIIDMLSEDLDGLILCTFRYYLGRKTIHANYFARSLAKVISELPRRVQYLIKRDLEKAFERDEDDSNFSPLGDECDKREWKKVLDICCRGVK